MRSNQNIWTGWWIFWWKPFHGFVLKQICWKQLQIDFSKLSLTCVVCLQMNQHGFYQLMKQTYLCPHFALHHITEKSPQMSTRETPSVVLCQSHFTSTKTSVQTPQNGIFTTAALLMKNLLLHLHQLLLIIDSCRMLVGQMPNLGQSWVATSKAFFGLFPFIISKVPVLNTCPSLMLFCLRSDI